MIEDFWELILQADSRASCASTKLDLLATLAITRIAQIQSAKSWIAQFQNGQWKDSYFGMKKSTSYTALGPLGRIDVPLLASE